MDSKIKTFLFIVIDVLHLLLEGLLIVFKFTVIFLRKVFNLLRKVFNFLKRCYSKFKTSLATLIRVKKKIKVFLFNPTDKKAQSSFSEFKKRNYFSLVFLELCLFSLIGLSFFDKKVALYLFYVPWGYVYYYVNPMLQVVIILLLCNIFYRDFFRKGAKAISLSLGLRGMWSSIFTEILMILYCVASYKIAYTYHYGIDPMIGMEMRLYEIPYESAIKRDLLALASNSPLFKWVIYASSDILNYISLFVLPPTRAKRSSVSLIYLLLNLLKFLYACLFIAFIVCQGKTFK